MDRSTRGTQEYDALVGGDPAQVLAALRTNSPQLFGTLVDTFGGPLSNADLSRRDRELATTAILAALGGAEPQLAVHTRAALRHGITPAELRALAEHVTLYAGFPRGLNALTTISQVLTDAGEPAPAALRRVRLADHETTVAQRGESGPPVVLLHALGTDWQMWEPIMARLAQGRRVFAYDLRGFGSAAGSPTPYTMADTAADLVGVLDALGLDQAHLVGLSLGGGIVQEVAVRYPARVASLALLATTDFPFPTFEGRARSAEEDGMAAQVVPTLTRWFSADALAENHAGVRYARERVLRTLPADFAAAWRAFKTVDVQGKLADFDRPTLVLAGSDDASATPEIMTAIAGRINGSVYREVKGGTHMLTLSEPDLTLAELDEFLPTA